MIRHAGDRMIPVTTKLTAEQVVITAGAIERRRSFLTMLGAIFASPKLPAPPETGIVPGEWVPIHRGPLFWQDLVDVQPMSGPTGQVFYLDLINTKTGNTTTFDDEIALGYCPVLARIRREERSTPTHSITSFLIPQCLQHLG